MLLPKNIGELTVKQFQGLTKIYQSDKDLLDKGCEAISLLTGMCEDDVLKMDYRDVQKAFNHINDILKSQPKEGLIKYVVSGTTVYRAVTDMSKISTAQYIDLKNLAKNDKWIDNMHLLLGCLYMPVNWYGKPKKYNGSRLDSVGADMLNIKLKYVYGTLFFYSAVFEKLSPTIQMSLEEALKVIADTVSQAEKDLQVS